MLCRNERKLYFSIVYAQHVLHCILNQIFRFFLKQLKVKVFSCFCFKTLSNSTTTVMACDNGLASVYCQSGSGTSQLLGVNITCCNTNNCNGGVATALKSSFAGSFLIKRDAQSVVTAYAVLSLAVTAGVFEICF
jgi:hypothetical protein